MGGALAVDGLVSNLDTQSIIQQLLAIERKPIDQINKKISEAEEKRSAFLDLSNRMLSLQGTATRLESGDLFKKTQATTSNSNILQASAPTSGVLGSFNFRVAQLASVHQVNSAGFATKDTLVGAGTLVIEQGDARLERPTKLSELNGFTGVAAGKFRVIDRSGKSAVIDVASAITVNDVLDRISGASGISVSAALNRDKTKIVLTDNSGGAGTLQVLEVGSGTTAADLGIVGNGSGTTLTGTHLNTLKSTTALAALNNGRGVNASKGGLAGNPADHQILLEYHNGAIFTSTAVNIGGFTTLGQIVDAINTGTAGKVIAGYGEGRITLRAPSSAAASARIRVTDVTAGDTVARDLGLQLNDLTWQDLYTNDIGVDLKGNTSASGSDTAYLKNQGTARTNLQGVEIGAATDGLGEATGYGQVIGGVNGTAGYQIGSVGINKVSPNGSGTSPDNTLRIKNQYINSSGTLVDGTSGLLRTLADHTVNANKGFTLGITFSLDAAQADGATTGILTIQEDATTGDFITIGTTRGGANTTFSVRARIGGVLRDAATTASAGQIKTDGTPNTMVFAWDQSVSQSNPVLRFNSNGVTAFGSNAITGTGYGATNSFDFTSTATDLRVGQTQDNSLGRAAENLEVSEFFVANTAYSQATIDDIVLGRRTLYGRELIAPINSSATSNLGGGIENSSTTTDFGSTIRVTDTQNKQYEVDLSLLKNTSEFKNLMQDVATFNTSNVSLGVNSSEIGFKFTDLAGGATTFNIADGSNGRTGSTRLFGAASVSSTDGKTITQANAEKATIYLGTRLAGMNFGKGIDAGKVRVTNTSGAITDIDFSGISTSTIVTIQDALNKLNTVTGVSAAINATGDGILLTDTAGGTGKLTLEDLSGKKTAQQLGITRDAEDTSNTSINGKFQRSVTLTATDTLTTAKDAIDALGLNINATLFNDGDLVAPNRLSLTSKETGEGAYFTAYTSGSTALSFATASLAKNATVLFGSIGGAAKPTRIENRTNTITSAVPGLTLNAVSASDEDVAVTISRDTTGITDDVQTFVEDFNAIISRISELTSFDTETFKRGILLGDSTAQRIRSQLSLMAINSVSDLPEGMNTLANVGIRIQNDGTLALSNSTFVSLLNNNFESVRDIFTAKPALTLSTKLSEFNDRRGVNFTGGSVGEFKITRKAGQTAEIDLSGSTLAADVIGKFNTQAQAAFGDSLVTMSISSDGKKFVITDTSAASGTTSLAAVGTTSTLSELGFTGVSSTTSELKSMEVNIFNTRGVGGRFHDEVNLITDPIDGTIAARTDGLDSQVKDFEEQIERQEERIEKVRERLQREFTQLEIFLGQSQNTASRLNQQLSAIAGLRR
ncbi:MAG: flagellar filament capping protein FliD [Planctomycetes bacterium]|nr:flagellar filament capping protein FliD [Planctomycetota bacterium]